MHYDENHLAEFVPMAHAVATTIQWCPDDHDDLVQEGLVALLKSMREYARPGAREVGSPEALAWYVMAGQMKWWYKPRDRNYTYCEIEEYHLVTLPEEAEVFFHTFLNQLRAAHGAVAVAVAEVLLRPGPEVGEIALHEANDKTVRAAAGALLRSYNTIRVTHEHVRVSLNLEYQQWHSVLRSVREFTRRYLQESTR